MQVEMYQIASLGFDFVYFDENNCMINIFTKF